MFDALVPAWNEEATVGAVVQALRAAPSVDRVLVLDDSSADATKERAKAEGAEVFTHEPPNWGKGEIMRAGLELVRSPFVGFFDADLLRFRPEHVEKMASFVREGFDQVCGLRDYGVLGAPSVLCPIITGERICWRELLDQVPWDCWEGYGVETGIGETARRLGMRTALVIMQGVRNRNKFSKAGWLLGLVRQTKMVGKIVGTRRVLGMYHGQACHCEST